MSRRSNWWDRLRKSRRAKEMGGLLLGLVSVVSFLSVMSYDAADATSFGHAPGTDGPVRNWIGVVGAEIAEWLLNLLGVGALVAPLLTLVLSWRIFRISARAVDWGRVAAMAALFLTLSALCDLIFGSIGYGGESFDNAGGYIGNRLAAALRSMLATTGAVLFSITMVLVLLIVTTRISLSALFDALQNASRAAIAKLLELWAQRRRAATPTRARARGLETQPVIASARPIPSHAARSRVPPSVERAP